MSPFGDGEVDPDAAAVDLLVAEGFLGGLGILDVLEVHERKSTRTAGLKMAPNF
jgi:hypothetical protein